jgi:hypothetical protein
MEADGVTMRARDIPVLRLTPKDSLVQLGYGVYQKRIQASETSNTRAIAVDMCQNKEMTNRPSPASAPSIHREVMTQLARSPALRLHLPGSMVPAE